MMYTRIQVYAGSESAGVFSVELPTQRKGDFIDAGYLRFGLRGIGDFDLIEHALDLLPDIVQVFAAQGLLFGLLFRSQSDRAFFV